MNSVTETVFTYLIPSWVYRSVLRNQMSISDITSFEKMKSILSSHDIATWVKLNDTLKVRDFNPSTAQLMCMFDKVNEEEFKKFIMPESQLDEINDDLQYRLLSCNPVLNNDSFYKIIIVPTAVYVIINEGFNSKITDPEFLLEFVKEYLKALYTRYKFTEVCETAMYKLYVDLV
jgi:hypothetical protein